jgi:hypothetical protein
VAGQSDFTPEEWVTLRRAMTSAGYIVAQSEGGGAADMLAEILAVTQRLGAAGRSHPNQLVREVAAMSQLQSGMRPGLKRWEYERQSLAAIQTATSLVAKKAPGDLQAFRTFVVEVAEAAANAHVEGSVAGLGGIRVTAAEAAAIVRVKKALGLA